MNSLDVPIKNSMNKIDRATQIEKNSHQIFPHQKKKPPMNGTNLQVLRPWRESPLHDNKLLLVL